MNLQSNRIIMTFLLLTSLLYSACKAQLSDISQSPFQVVNLGDSVTLTCHVPRFTKMVFWCKVTAGKGLELLASLETYYSIKNFRQETDRLSVKYKDGGVSLTIHKTVREDVGTYYCGGTTLDAVMFGRGTFLMIQGVKMFSNTVVQKPNSLSIQSGDSVNISCCVRSLHCAANHTDVMWLKNSVHSAPEMIHSSGYETGNCQTTGSGETTCEYDYLMQDLTSDDAGTYYCVATVCGELLFGNGTVVQIQGESKSLHLSPAVVALILSNCLLLLATLLLLWRLCRKHERSPITASYRSRDESPEDNQFRDGVLYTTVSSDPSNSSHRSTLLKHNSDTTVVYSNVRRSFRD
uniref:Ig-like domain-containing protein n=1 Tax=Salarias fasciatus TaxID=181472 RepID=A0A672GAB3_SALFA